MAPTCVSWRAAAVGDGYIWGGTAVSFLLGQHRRLLLVDLAAQVREDLHILNAISAIAPCAKDSPMAATSFQRSKAMVDGKTAAYAKLFSDSDIHGSMRLFCDSAALAEQAQQAAVAMLNACDPVVPVAAVGALRPAVHSVCGAVEFEPPEVDVDFMPRRA